MKVVINKCYGGFGLSHAAVMRYAELSGFVLYPYLSHIDREIYKDRAVIGNPDLIHHYSRVPLDGLTRDRHGDPQVPNESYFSEDGLRRHDPVLVRVVEELGDTSFGRYAKLRVVDIPDGTDYEIAEYDGMEHVAETHRTWT